MGEITMGTLYEGDTNDDNVVEGLDYSTVVMCFGKSVTDPAAPPQTPWCDFNNDSAVTGLDYSRLLANFGKYGSDME
jgi:hypothetical protein